MDTYRHHRDIAARYVNKDIGATSIGLDDSDPQYASLSRAGKSNDSFDFSFLHRVHSRSEDSRFRAFTDSLLEAEQALRHFARL
jgi:hypothetical protein